MQTLLEKSVRAFCAGARGGRGTCGTRAAMLAASVVMSVLTVLGGWQHASTASAVDYSTPQALLAQQFHGSERVTYRKFHLDPSQRGQLEARLGRALPKPDYTFFLATTHGQPDGYALFDEQIGQHEPISFGTFFDTHGAVTRVEILAYREPYGDGIRTERFRKQFVGKNAKSPFRPGGDIDAISGATISSRSLCIGVARAAALLDTALRAWGPSLGAQ